MSKKDKQNIPPYLCGNDKPENFCMVPPELWKYEKFQKLTPAAKEFYLFLCAYTATKEQKQTLYNTLKEYNAILGLGWNEEDIKYKTWGNKRTGQFATLFVCPAKHMLEYDKKFSPQYTSKYKKQLVKAGFIRVVYAGKGKYSAWDKNQTVWEFLFST